jgi:hypothetical protein
MTEPDGGYAPDPASILSENELHNAVVGLLGDSYDRAVESRTGVSKTTVNALRNQRRRLTLKTLGLIVDAYDPTRRDAWLAAWRRVNARPTTATSEPATEVATASSDGHAAVPTPVTPPIQTRPSLHRIFSRPRWFAVGGVATAACVAASVAALAITGGRGGHAVTTGAQDGRAGPVIPAGPGSLGAPGPFGGPPPAGLPPARDAGQVMTHGCPVAGLRTKARVIEQPGARSTGLSLRAAAYTYYPASNPTLVVGGKLSGQPAAGQRLVGADWADPRTRDSTRAHSSGDGHFYPGMELELTDENCFTVPPYHVGYDGYAGITTRIYILMTAADQAPTLGWEAAQLGGFTQSDLARRKVDVLGYFTVPSHGA